METRTFTKRKSSAIGKGNFVLKVFILQILFNVMAQVAPVSAQSVLFDFDNAPLLTPLPISQTAGGITAQFSATGQGYSIQNANAMGFTPPGFAGLCIYPSSVFLADLLIGFDQNLTHFSMMYSCQELGCDDAATMRVTAYKNGVYAGTNTQIAANPGTWPVDTLTCNFPLGFDSVVIHYDSPPPTCQDYGVIYLADNMRVTAANPTSMQNQQITISGSISPNPVIQSTTFSFYLLESGNTSLAVFDAQGKLIKNLFEGTLNAGEHQINWNVNEDAVECGLYFLTMTGENYSQSYKLVVVK